MRTGRGERFIVAWVKVSPALIWEPPVSIAIGPVYFVPRDGCTVIGCGVVKAAGSSGSLRARLE